MNLQNPHQPISHAVSTHLRSSQEHATAFANRTTTGVLLTNYSSLLLSLTYFWPKPRSPLIRYKSASSFLTALCTLTYFPKLVSVFSSISHLSLAEYHQILNFPVTNSNSRGWDSNFLPLIFVLVLSFITTALTTLVQTDYFQALRFAGMLLSQRIQIFITGNSYHILFTFRSWDAKRNNSPWTTVNFN